MTVRRSSNLTSRKEAGQGPRRLTRLTGEAGTPLLKLATVAGRR
jgi:hypothetical protein